MEIKKISTEKLIDLKPNQRPVALDTFIGQWHITNVLRTAITSAQKRESPIGHTLFSGPSGFGKTTLATIIAKEMQSTIKAVTGYAISKPAEIISLINSLEKWDILFIDEIHRLRPNVEEVLYIAMEDYVIDVVMPEWDNMRIPVEPFTLIGATTKPESLSQPLKNRFVYTHHFMDYMPEEKHAIIGHYLNHHTISLADELWLEMISEKVDSVPREIFNLTVRLRDYIVTNNIDVVDSNIWDAFIAHSRIDDGGMSVLHQKYLDVLEKYDRPIGLRTIAVQLGMNEKAIEEDVEPLLLKLGKIEKKAGGRVLV